MNEYVSLQKITTLFEQYQQSQSGIGLNGFGYGNIVDFGLDLTGGTQTLYPFMFVTPINVSYDENITTYTISIIFADRINDDKFNLVDVQSDMSIQAKRFISWIKRGMNQTPNLYDNMEINLPVTGIPFLERFNDYLGGISIDAEVVVFEDINACDYYDFGVSPTPTPTVTPTCPITTQYLEVVLQDSTKFKLALFNDAGFTSPADALCDYVVSGTAYGDLGTIYTGTETILEGQHQKQFDLAPVLLPGEVVINFEVHGVNTSTCVCPVIVNFTPYITPTPTVTPTNTPTPSITPTITPSVSVSPTPTLTPTPTSSPAPPVDTDAALYLADVLSAGGTLDATISAATNTLFTSLKSNNLYDKLEYFYPMLGATSGSTRLMGKRVSGTTYDWTIQGNSTNPLSYDYSGVTGGGSGSNIEYANLNFLGSEYGDSENASVVLYSNGDTTAQFGYEVSSKENDADVFILRYGNSLLYKSVGTGFKTTSNTDASGCYVSTITGDTTLKVFRNGSVILNTADARNFAGGVNMVLFARGTSEGSHRRLAFAGFGLGLSDTEAQTLSTIINTFQTTLGRNTY